MHIIISSIFYWIRLFKLNTLTTDGEYFCHNKKSFSITLQMHYAFLGSKLAP